MENVSRQCGPVAGFVAIFMRARLFSSNVPLLMFLTLTWPMDSSLACRGTLRQILRLEIIMIRALIALLVSLSPALVCGQVPFPQLPQPITTFSFEDKDWGVEAPIIPKRGPQYLAPTPTSIPGARVIKTLELKGLLGTNKDVVVVDVLDSKARKSIPGAFWMSGAGDGQLFAAEKNRFATALERLTRGDKTRPIVFLCIGSECWLSYNASLHALEAGYKDVIWYRGGTNSWRGASLEWKQPESVSW